MRIRFHDNERKKLQWAGEITGLSQALIIRKSLLKFKNLSEVEYVAVPNISLPATYSSRRKKNSEAIEVEIPDRLRNGMDALMIRKIVTWYLNRFEVRREKLNIPGCIARSILVLKGD